MTGPSAPDERFPYAALTATPIVDQPRGWARWRALGTYVDLRVNPDVVEDACAHAREMLDEVDLCYSRFRPHSELVHVNRHPGRHQVTALLLGAVTVALDAAAQTDGLVDPTLEAILVSAGYDRTFGDLADDMGARAAPVLGPPAAEGVSWREVAVDPSAGTLTLPPGLTLDLGATGKAYAADLLALTLAQRFDTPVLVSLGGDVRIVGPGAGPHTLVIGDRIAEIDRGDPTCLVSVPEGGVATSSTGTRRWLRGGQLWHHVIDPRTGLPADGPWRTVTTLGRSSVTANIASTAALVLGRAALPWLRDRDVAARLVSVDGEVVRTPAWSDTVCEEAA